MRRADRACRWRSWQADRADRDADRGDDLRCPSVDDEFGRATADVDDDVRRCPRGQGTHSGNRGERELGLARSRDHLDLRSQDLFGRPDELARVRWPRASLGSRSMVGCRATPCSSITRRYSPQISSDFAIDSAASTPLASRPLPSRPNRHRSTTRWSLASTINSSSVFVPISMTAVGIMEMVVARTASKPSRRAAIARRASRNLYSHLVLRQLRGACGIGNGQCSRRTGRRNTDRPPRRRA